MTSPGFGEELRYVGRDGLTGMPARVNDRFIAETERAIERYGLDAREPVPPPAPGPLDIAWLTVAKLGITRARVARYGLDAYGRLDVPQDTSTVGWNPAYCQLPGGGGATFLAAHVYFGGRPGIFSRLSTLSGGDSLEIGLNDGTVHAYRVTSVVEYALAAIDMGALLRGREGIESVTLMTCSGPPNEGEYAFRTVVLAERAS
ncbi:MAG: class F sortase [Dehalococcoidia bacterium]